MKTVRDLESYRTGRTNIKGGLVFVVGTQEASPWGYCSKYDKICYGNCNADDQLSKSSKEVGEKTGGLEGTSGVFFFPLLNVDARYNQNTGVVIRDSSGTFVAATARFVEHVLDAPKAEAMALREGLSLA